MKNQLTMIVPFYNAELYIEACIMSIVQQTNQNFDLLLLSDGSTDASVTIAKGLLEQYQRPYQLVTLAHNQGHSEARNKAMKQVDTSYFMFLDADDTLAPYAVDSYLVYLDGTLDTLIAPISSFTVTPQTNYHVEDLQVKHGEMRTSPAVLLEHQSVCNIVFKTSIAHENHLLLNTSLNIYSDISFLIDYSLHSHRFVRLSGVSFYYQGEVYDPFASSQLTERPINVRFDDYISSFNDAFQRTQGHPEMRYSVLEAMRTFIRQEFEPSLFDIEQRYQTYGQRLAPIVRLLKPVLKKEKNLLFRLELLLLSKKTVKLARFVNKKRYQSRFIKDLLFCPNKRSYAKYMLFNSERAVKNDVIVFESFGGKTYNDSPKYIYEYMKQRYPDYQYYWIFQDINDTTLPSDCHKIEKGSPAYYDIFKKAHIWVSNARVPLFLKKKSNQCYVQTWHGTPLKRLANDMLKVRIPNTTTVDYKQHFYWATRRWDYLVSPNAYSTAIFQSAFWMQPDQILEVGYPRNDVIVKRQNDEGYLQTIRQNLGIPKDKKVILYAPTWRDDQYTDAGLYQFDLKLDLAKFKQVLSEDYVILLRLHYFIANKINLSGMDDFAYDVSEYKDVSELYLISDVLVTDYSSVMFDFGILKRPQLFYAYDVDNYDKDLRGFYIDYLKDLPGPIYQTSDDLLQGLQNLNSIQVAYQKQIEAFYQRFCSLENGKAAEYIGELIHQEIQKNT
ncbi:bifunctional glycosyltransferase/CDP-glycerol:glycerophosphate glycerophosphotransferase [Staphylococcus americanisciuri]|uniref:Bifunctional glycosyltransferase family 2 protein/CDP-glycerol:glycerophosphate glycerophosphotransferase n=1 Tax=Staphylococcus americanisciuri TaxID=2973940 RepID=A0ABT2F3Q5_9STAP|nr:bifunctional glycosyltransferase family 2 protein/CDP-glycerol:glycerophosphate glycerophosphotransferase [Staphylococcus americanisciuri]MCS4487111.1 bifunctional glycosyltransferase family 2 protein/CDP-glycerol:glycerophosphate glycerophosphotransferase [Staphylococcus americanisciuri]